MHYECFTEILSSKIRGEMFRLILGTSAEELHMCEIERRSGYTMGTIQTELKYSKLSLQSDD